MAARDEQEENRPSFAALLRQHRRAAGLSQEELAERARLSPDTLSNLERGHSQIPQYHTVRLLAAALLLSAPEHAALEEAVVRRRGPQRSPASPVSATRAALPNAHASPRQGHTSDVPNNLPAHLTTFVGREREVAEVTGLLDTTRLVTLTGTGGVGKTRLALHVAGAVAGAYPQGVWIVELAPLADPALVPRAIAAACGIREVPGHTVEERLVTTLRQGRVLLVLDNCEHLLDSCTVLAQTLLEQCASLRVLTTSRQPLGIGGETVWRVPSLPLPDQSAGAPLDQLVDNDAVRLFIERAVATRPDFTVSAETAQAVALVCRRLDGIPLAIELAAARVRVLTVEGISQRLDDRFHLLTGGNRTALPRQQTLRALVDWSHDLLTDQEKILFRRLSVFAGDWDVEAAEAVCTGGAIAHEEVLDLLSGLVDKSLVLADRRDRQVEPPEMRYQLLETIRQYAAERARHAGEEAGARTRHLAWALALAEQGESNLRGPRQREWLERLEGEHDNLRAALACAYESAEQVEKGLRLTAALWRFWFLHGYFSEGLDWLEKGLARCAQGAVRPEPRLHGRLLSGACVLAGTLGLMQRLATLQEENVARARALGDKQSLAEALLSSRLDIGVENPDTVEALALFRELGDRHGMAEALSHLAWTYNGWDYGTAERLFGESISLYRALDDPGGLVEALQGLGLVAKEQADFDQAQVLLEESLALARTLGNTSGVACALSDLGEVAYDRGDYRRAEALFEESLPLRRALRDAFGLTMTLQHLGHAARALRDTAKARARYEEALAVGRARGIPGQLVSCLVWAGCMAAGLGDSAGAVRSFEEVRQLTPEQDWVPGLFLWVAAWEALALTNLGIVARHQGDLAQATALHTEALALHQRLAPQWATTPHQVLMNVCALVLAAWGDTARAAGEEKRAAALYRRGLSQGHAQAAAGREMCLYGLASIALTQGQSVRAARLCAAAAGQRQPRLWNEPGTYVIVDQTAGEQLLVAIRAELGDDAFATAWNDGLAMTSEQLMWSPA